MRIIKFGGKSLDGEEALSQAVDIIEQESLSGPIAVVVSARGNLTDQLYQLIEEAETGSNYLITLSGISKSWADPNADYKGRLDAELHRKIEAVATLGECPGSIQNEILAYGELSSAYQVARELNKRGFEAKNIDARELLVTETRNGNVMVNHAKSERSTNAYFKELEPHVIPIVTGFIARGENQKTSILGRNGSNYSASLLASYLDASEVKNYTHVNGLYTAQPELIQQARIIPHLTFQEAHELANFGASILHPTTIEPLVEKNIPLRLLNTFQPEAEGTLIQGKDISGEIKSISSVEEVGLVQISGNQLQGQIGIDARIFTVLSQHYINISMISQASSERGIGFVIQAKNADRAVHLLNQEFKNEIEKKIINLIEVRTDVSVVAIIGNRIDKIHHALGALARNQIRPYMITNNIDGHNLSIVVDSKDRVKAIQILHGQIFGSKKRIHLFLFGRGNVGKTLIEQLYDQKPVLFKNQGIELNIVAIMNSTHWISNIDGLGIMEHQNFEEAATEYSFSEVLELARKNQLENLVAVDLSSSESLTEKYGALIKEGFDIVTANKLANTLPFAKYNRLRRLIIEKEKQFKYETNVGAGLPLIDTLHHLISSGDKVRKVIGVFSGSLSYIFNHFSHRQDPFSTILEEARKGGLTEPDPREDLSGNDVARKLLILAREIGWAKDFDDVKVESLIPKALAELESVTEFEAHYKDLDVHYENLRKNLPEGFVLRYVGELDVTSGQLQVSLQGVSSQSVLGQLQDADTVFEIYTDSYAERPMVIQGAGAGAAVTARGVFGDILRVANGR